MSPTRIVLVGFMGAGKTSVGRELAIFLNWDFVDLDVAVEEREGASVPEIFETRGEPGFRAAERAAAAALAGRAQVVIAAGGGAFHDEATRAELRQPGTLTVWLSCGFEILMERIGRGGARPLAGSRETMRALLHQREKSYRLADRFVDTTAASPSEVARSVGRAVVDNPNAARGGPCAT